MDKNQQLEPIKKESDFDNLVHLRQNLSVYMAARKRLENQKSSLNKQKTKFTAEKGEYSDNKTYIEKHSNLKKKTAYHTIWDSLYNLIYYNDGVVLGIIFAIIGGLLTLYIGFKKFNAFSSLRTGVFCLFVGICIGVLLYRLIKAVHEPLLDFFDNFWGRNSRQYKYDNEYEKQFKSIFKHSKKSREKRILALNDGISQINQSIGTIDAQIRSLDNAFYSLKFRILPEDYRYVDYILFLFYSGRADTLKEALHSVDEERRAQSIVNSISALSEKMNRTVTTICSRIDKLSSQIEKNSNAMLQGLDTIGTNMLSLGYSMAQGFSNINSTMKNSLSSINSSISSLGNEICSASMSLNNSLVDVNNLLIEGNRIASYSIPAGNIRPN